MRRLALLTVILVTGLCGVAEAHSVRLHAEPKVKSWKSPQHFIHDVRIRAYVGGKELSQHLFEGACGATYEGQGVMLIVHVCNSPLIRVSYSARTPTAVTFIYSG